MEINIYTKSNCVQCDQTKRYLDKAGIEYKEFDLEANPELLDYWTEQGYMSAPIVGTETETWSGFRLEKLKALVVKHQLDKGHKVA